MQINHYPENSKSPPSPSPGLSHSIANFLGTKWYDKSTVHDEKKKKWSRLKEMQESGLQEMDGLDRWSGNNYAFFICSRHTVFIRIGNRMGAGKKKKGKKGQGGSQQPVGRLKVNSSHFPRAVGGRLI